MITDINQRHTDEEDEGSGSGGQSGEIQFRYQDAMSVAPRDDALPPGDERRLLAIENAQHKSAVDRQRNLIKERQAKKEGRIFFNPDNQNSFGLGEGFDPGAGQNPNKPHPITQFAQFSGQDPQVVAIPGENRDTNNLEKRNELKYQNQLKLKNAPKFNPRPSGPGSIRR